MGEIQGINSPTSAGLQGKPRKSILLALLPLVIINQLILLYASPISFYPDEQGHFSYANHLANTGLRPEPDDPVSLGEEMLAFNLGAKAIHINGDIGISEKVINAASFPPDARCEGGKANLQSAATYPTPYYRMGAFLLNLFPNAGILTRFTLMRGYSLLLWGATLFSISRILSRVFPESPMKQAVAFSLIAFQPRFCSMGVSVNSDILGVLVLTLVIWGGLLLIRSERWMTLPVLLFFLLSLFAFSVKQHLITSLAIFALAFAIQQALHPADRLPPAHRVGILAGTVALLIVGAFLLIHNSKVVGNAKLFALWSTEGGILSLFRYLVDSMFSFVIFPEVYPESFRNLSNTNMTFTVFVQYWSYLVPGTNANYVVPDNIMFFLVKLFVWAGVAGYLLSILRKNLPMEAVFLGSITAGWLLFIVGITWLFLNRDTHLQGRYFTYVIGAAIPALVAGMSGLLGRRFVPVGKAVILLMIFFFEYELLEMLVLVYRR